MKKKHEVENLEVLPPFKANFSTRSDGVQLAANQSPGLHLNHKTQRDQNIRDSGAFAIWITSMCCSAHHFTACFLCRYHVYSSDTQGPVPGRTCILSHQAIRYISWQEVLPKYCSVTICIVTKKFHISSSLTMIFWISHISGTVPNRNDTWNKQQIRTHG